MAEQMRDAARPVTKVECLANRIMALRETRCAVHQHYLCSLCAGDWIAAHTEAAVRIQLLDDQKAAAEVVDAATADLSRTGLPGLRGTATLSP